MVSVQNGPFFQLFILDNICQENVLYDILERKKAFQDYKKKISKSRKIDIFPKGLTHAVWSNDGHFSNFFFQVIQAGKMSFTIFYNEKNPFLGYKNKKFKKSKIRHFSKRVNPWFWSKYGHISNYFFQALQAKKGFLPYSRTKKGLSRL